MKPTITKNDIDLTVSVQVNEARDDLKKITILAKGAHDSFSLHFSPSQAEELEDLLRAAREQITAKV